MEIHMSSFLMAFLYLGVGFLIMVFFLQWKWSKVCSKNIRTLTALKTGAGKWGLAPSSGGVVELYDKEHDQWMTYPINELATIEVDYPGVGFVPRFLQKTIRLVLLNEGDTEPVLNRANHRDMIASPDVIEYIKSIAVSEEDQQKLEVYTSKLRTYPTRPTVSDPLTLASLMRQQAMKALAQVSTELMDTLKSINTKLTRLGNFNATYIYIGLGLVIVLLAFNIYFTMQSGSLDISEIIKNQELIFKALGIKPELP